MVLVYILTEDDERCTIAVLEFRELLKYTIGVLLTLTSPVITYLDV